MSDAQTEKMSPDLASELAYVRSLAEEGRDAPIVSGVYYVLWGVLMGVAALIFYFTVTGVLPIGRAGLLAPWIVAGAVGWVLSMTMGRFLGTKPGALTLGNRAASSTWFAVGLFMSVFWVAMMFVHDDFTQLGVPRYFLFSMMFPVAFGLYGVAFFATAAAARAPWLKYFAYLSWAFSVGAMFLAGSDKQFLLGSAGCFACAALPGALLMRAEPKEIV